MARRTILSEYDFDGFIAFWNMYPRREAKIDAYRAWQQKQPTAETQALILAALEWQVIANDWQNTPSFCPLPATYLRGERWLDERRVNVERRVQTPAHDFLAWFVDEYQAQRNGARYLVLVKDGGIVKGLLGVHAPERLRQLATVLLTSNEEWIESTDRGIAVFAAKINWLEDRLAAWEKRRHT